MKRYGQLWPLITDFGNLLLAAKKARKGKRYNPNVLKFEHNLEQQLLALQSQLQEKTWQPGDYYTFEIVEPKKRLISAAPYRDRVVHHALCNVIQPLFERGFVNDSYANRVGFGSHRALKRFAHYARRYRYVLQCDIQKYFPNIDHEILKNQLRRKLKCKDTLWLLNLIIDHSNRQPAPPLYFGGDDLISAMRRKGLPVGNLTSQFFANVYLNGFDHFIKEQLKIAGYVRYVDDFALFGNDREQLQSVRFALEEKLADIRLKIHPVKSQLFATQKGARFLGFRIFPTHIRANTDGLRRARHRLRSQQQAYAAGNISLAQLTQSIRSWLAHLAHGNTWYLRKTLLSRYGFVRE
ncbi:RNA-directed DNA polymerase [Candidatus Venteria ishoeyi]|uniref:Reverse transcriptase (RNA-dependent DNA polymerase) n=1 Tax=Candidatus Venteria ishoeyi TaxID=1899563 RepID=A0A1H6FAI1_9GAMM|nr:RNA-directed DNA polymerase [Candidatus Venteria ishoeyi]SEH06633.1 Reverse transcriptase (RNA-dependent DNA polymerase) [Candidatus Venteria ishoeyi]